MPPIKIQHVVSCSSEDKVHKGENLLSTDHYRKWKCANAGEKQVSIILQLEKETKISGIDIGNEGSALIEVLVGRSSDHKQEFQVLVVTSSFMSPKESRQETNLNQVRMFGHDKLNQSVANEKWDRVKIVCSQPFNTHMKYGISFIVLHSSDSSKESKTEDAKNNNEVSESIGAFKLKQKDDDKVTIGSLFSKMKEANKNKTPPNEKVPESNNTSALAIRNASSETPKKEKSPVIKPKTTSKPERTKDVTRNGEKEQSPISSKPKKQSDYSNNHEKDKASEDKKKDTPSTSSSHKRKSEDSSLNSSTHSSKGSDKKKPFHHIMDGVVFVLSGYQNPQRSEIRDKALAMGASYRQDWSKGCTHLICAFANTPKYKQVQSSGGKIVSEKWITHSFKKRKVQSWRKYRLDSDSSDSESESETETEEEDEEPPTKKSKHSDSQGSSSSSKNKHKDTEDTKKKVSPKKVPKIEEEDSDEVYLASTDVDDESGEDTEDEINRVEANNASKNSPNTGKKDTSKMSLPPLPDFYKNYVFYLHSDFDSDQRKKLERYIIGCGGEISEYMTEKINYILSDSDWVKDFDEALSENKKVKIVKSSWVHKCLKVGDFTSATDYLIKRKHK